MMIKRRVTRPSDTNSRSYHRRSVAEMVGFGSRSRSAGQGGGGGGMFVGAGGTSSMRSSIGTSVRSSEKHRVDAGLARERLELEREDRRVQGLG